MVAVIAGNGLGLAGTSLAQLGMAPGGLSGLGQSGASQYVNIATGNLVLQGQDQDLVAQEFLAGVVRTYNSLGAAGDYGSAGGWLLGLDRRLMVTGTPGTAGCTITREGGDGADEVFTYDAARGLYVATNERGAEDTLAWDGGTSTWTLTAGGSRDEETYDLNGRLLGLVDGETGAHYTLGYDANNRLISVTAGDGEALELGYDAQGRVSSLSTLAIPPGGGAAVLQSRVSYAYDSLGRLVGVTTDLTPDNTADGSVFTTTYTYDGDSTRIASLTQSDGVTVAYTYAQDSAGVWRVATVTTGSGAAAQTLSFSYDLTDRTTTVTDAGGRAWVYGYNAAGDLTSVASPPVNGQARVTTYTYTADGQVAAVTDTQGRATIYEYDDRGNRVLERDADGNTIAWTYNSDDEVLTRTVYRTADPDGSDPANAGQASDPSTTWYVYGAGSDGHADQLRYVIDADGEVTETQYDAQGQVSLTRAYAADVYDTSALTTSTVPTLAAMDAWAAGQDLTRTTRVDYAYDTAGRLSGKTAWDTVDASGAGVADAGAAITHYVYDAQGLLRQQVTERGADRSINEATAYSYDGLGRLIGSTDALGNVTTYAYQAGGTLTVTYANGLVRTEVRNSAGELITVTESAAGQPARTTHYIYDAEGQLRATEDPSGAITYTFYDAAGTVSGTVDALGAVTQYVRDGDGRLVETRQYATAIDTTSWLSAGAVTAATPTDIASVVPAASAGDRISLSLYDAAGVHVADVDAEGHVATYEHDGAGNLVTTTEYATALSVDALNTLQGTPTWGVLQSDLTSITSTDDRVTRAFYDVANRQVATLDAAGYLATVAYDAAGRVIKTTAYATGLTAAQVAALGDAPSLQSVLADVGSSAQDQVTRNYYDDRGRLVAAVDAGGYLTTTSYDETTHSATSTRYAEALTAAQLSALTGHETLATLVGDVAGSIVQTSVAEYDADGRLVSATAADGTVTTHTYDAAGNVLGTTVTPPAGGQVRSSSATWDAFGERLSATDGAGATTTYAYNARGQKVLITDALGNNTWAFYDADGRLVYSVKGIANGATQNALGEVTAYTYDALGEVTATTRYAGRLNLTALGLATTTSLGALASAVAAIANPAADAASTYTYTLDGLTASVRDGLGYTTQSTYDAFGDLASVQRQLSGAGQALSAGNSTTTAYTYDARGERTGETDDVGGLSRTTGVGYDAFGRVTSRTDGNGNVTTYRYDALGRQISVNETVEGVARSAQTTYDAYGRILTQTDALGQVTVYQYSPDTHTVTVTTPDGVKLTTTRDAYGDTVSVTDNLGNVTRYTYDGDGRRLGTTDALGNVTQDAYDADGNLIRSTDANGVVTAYTYDAAGRVLTRTLDPSGNDFVTTYTWDGRGQQLSVTDPGGVTTTYAYDADGDVLSVVKDAGTNHLNLTTTYTWDGAGDRLSVTEGADTAAARTSAYTYDALGRLTKTEVDPAGLDLTTRYGYDANNNLIARTDADGNVAHYVYNEANEEVYAIDAGGGVTQVWHDADGRVTATRQYATALTADQLTALGSTPSAGDVAGEVTASADDAVTYTVYNDDGEVAYSIDASGYVTLTRHDPDGRALEVLAYANALSASTLAGLQASLQQGTALAALAGAVSAAGNTDQNARAMLNLYDADGRVRFVVQQDSVGGQLCGVVSEQRYDADGRVVAKLAYGTTLALNTTDRLCDQLTADSVAQSLAGSAVHATEYVYSAVGTLRYTVGPDGDVTENHYDASGNLTSERRWLAAITLPATLTTATLAAAVSATNTAGNARTTTYAYDRASRLLQVSDDLGVKASYTYDALGQKLTSTDRDGATTTYVYDQAGRLVEQDSAPVTSSSYTSGNTLVAAAKASIVTRYAYDGNGNVTSKTEAYGTPVARTTTYAYDSRGNQVAITYPSATYVNASGQTVTGTVTATVTYDALGRAVVNRDVDGNYEYKVYNAAGEVAYDIDGNGYVTAYTYDAAGNPTTVTRYATALDTAAIGGGWVAGQPVSLADMQKSGVLVADADANGGDRTLTTTYDQLGQKLCVTESSISYAYYTGSPTGQWSTGSPTTTYTYDAYGNVTSTSVLLQGAYGTVGQSGYMAPEWATTYAYYDAAGQKTLAVDALGYVTTWAYDAQGNVTQTTQYARAILTGLSTGTPPALPAAGDAATGFDRTTVYTYDAIGRKATQTDSGDYSSLVSGSQGIAAGSRVTSWTYDGEDRVTSITVDGATTATTYDVLGRVVKITQPERSVLRSNWQTLLTSAGGSSEDLATAGLYEAVSPVTMLTYDALGDALCSSTTAAGAAGGSQVSYSHYDALGRVTSETDASGTTYTHTYDAAGNLTSTSHVLSGDEVTTHFAYDADNQRVSSVTQRYAGGQWVTEAATYVQYDAFGDIVAKGDGSHAYSTTGYEFAYQYDNAGNLIAATDPKTGATHSYSYRLDGVQLGDAWTVTGGGAQAYTSWLVDALGRHRTQCMPSYTTGVAQNAAQVNETFDRWGNVLSVTDARGYLTTYVYDSNNKLIQQTEPEVLVTAEDGTRTWQTPVKAWYYDVDGHLTGVTDEDQHTTTQAFDAAGELVSTTDALGAVTRYGYDGLGRQVAKQTAITGTTSHLTWQDFNALGQVIAQGDFQLDATDNTKFDKSIQQTYVLDQDGNRVTVADALGNTSYYSYDSLGHVLKSQTPDQHAAGKADTFTYDVNGNKTGETTADGDSETWGYDAYGRVRAHTDLSGATYTYTYDADSGLLTAETSTWNPAGQTDPGYVPPSNGTGTTSEAYTWYADGQVASRVQKTGTLTTTSTSYQYDADGNQADENVQTEDGAGGVVDVDTQSRYDSHNRLSEVTEYDTSTGSDVGIVRTAYNYDAAGNRRAVFVQSGYGGSPINTGSGGPTATSIGTQTVQPGTAWSFDAAPSFTDTLGFGLTFTAKQANGDPLPSWLQCNSSGVLTGTATAAAGSWSVTVTGTDVDGNSASVTFTVTVPVVDPVFPAFTPPAANTGVALSFSVPAASDANGSAISYQATYHNGSTWTATLPAWLHFDAATRTFTGTPPAGSAGTYQLAVSAYAANGGSKALIFNLGVAASPPVYHNNLASQTAFGTRGFSYILPAGAFTEVDGSTLTYSAGTYAAGSETALPGWLTFNASTHTFSGTPPQSAVGQTFNLYVKATNASGQVAEGHFSLSVQQYVQPVPVYHGSLANQSGVIGGSSLSIPLPAGAFTESDGGALTYSGYVLIPEHTQTYWNASHTEPLDRTIAAQWVALSTVGLSINATSGTLSGVPTTLDYVTNELISPHGYAHDTSYQIEIVATNGTAETAAGTFTLSNSYAPPALLAPLANPVAQNPGAGWLPIVTAGTFSDPAGHGLSYTATLADGSALPAGLTWSGTELDIGTPLAAGTYTITVTATDDGSASSTFTLTINNVAPVFTASPANLSLTKGAAMAADTVPAATDANGDTLSYSASGLPPGVSFNAATRTFSGTPSSTGSWTVTYTATDSHGAVASKTFTITVSNPVPQPPVYNGGIPATVELMPLSGGTDTYTFPATAFSSPAGETLTYTALQSDGSALPAYLTFDGATRTFTAHSARFDRQATVTLTATDTQGRTVSDTFSFYVDGTAINTNAVPAGTQATAADMAATTQATQQATSTTPNTQSYWFTYDADNRVQIDGGSLSGGQIVLAADGKSHENEYDLAGDVVTELTSDGPDTWQQRSDYDTRGQLIDTWYQTRAGVAAPTGPGILPLQGIQWRMSYDADGHVIRKDTLFAPGTMFDDGSSGTIGPEGDLTGDVGGWLRESEVSTYDADGQLLSQIDYGRPAGTAVGSGIHSIYDTGSGQQVAWYNAVEAAMNSGATDDTQQEGVGIDPSTITEMIVVTRLDDSTASGASGYDLEGNLVTYRYTYLGNEYPAALPVGVEIGEVDTYTVAYLKKDGYLEQSTAGSSTNSGRLPASDVSDYDAFGRRIVIAQQVQQDDGTVSEPVRVFAYDAEGEILERRDGTATATGGGGAPVGGGGGGGGGGGIGGGGTGIKQNAVQALATTAATTDAFTATGGAATHHYAYAEGQQLGEVDEAGGIDVLSGVTGFSNTTQGTTTYVVQNDDTLASIAQAVYGDASLWYVVADANGLTDDSGLAPGQTLKLPEVQTNSNTAQTFKPYNPNKISGSTTPALPQAPPPAKHCSALAEIVVIAVVIVASIFTAGVAAEAFAGTLGTAAGGGLGGIMSAGLSAATGATLGTAAVSASGVIVGGAEAAAAAAIGGAVGNAAGQLVGDAEGIHSGFSWGEMLAGGLTAAAGSEISGTMGGNAGFLRDVGAGGRAAFSATATSLASYGANKLVGEPATFSWRGLTANALAAGIAAEVTPEVDDALHLNSYDVAGDFTNQFIQGTLDMQIGRKLGMDTPVDYGQIAVDAFGNALANKIDGQDAVLEAKAKVHALYDMMSKKRSSLVCYAPWATQSDQSGGQPLVADGIYPGTAGKNLSAYGIPKVQLPNGEWYFASIDQTGQFAMVPGATVVNYKAYRHIDGSIEYVAADANGNYDVPPAAVTVDVHELQYDGVVLGKDYGAPTDWLSAITAEGVTGGDPANSLRRQVAVDTDAHPDLAAFIDPGTGEVNPLQWDDFESAAIKDGLKMGVTSNGLATPFQLGLDNAKILANGTNMVWVNVYNPTIAGGFVADTIFEAALGQLGEKQTVEVAIQEQMKDALAYNANLDQVLGNPVATTLTTFVGHSQGTINGNWAIDWMSPGQKKMINVIDVGTASWHLPTGVAHFTSITDEDDPVTRLTFARLLADSSCAEQNSDTYQFITTHMNQDFGAANSGNHHSLYLYAGTPEFQRALHFVPRSVPYVPADPFPH